MLKRMMLGIGLLVAAACAHRPAQWRGDPPLPRVDHILIEVKDLNASLAFYRDGLRLRLKSKSHEFITLDAANIGVALWQKHWDWEAPRGEHERQGLGIYPHFEFADVPAVVERLGKSGVKIVQEPRKYRWGTEAFVSDPDGIVWALVTPANSPPQMSKKTMEGRYPLLGLNDRTINDLKKDLMKHPELIPFKGEVGGKMDFYSEEFIHILSNDWVYAYFEDGHIAGQMLLKYRMDGGKITWKVLQSELE
jgi:catechol 2,3-dioxygenase-like lactoylglutathione lyase family enzyme